MEIRDYYDNVVLRVVDNKCYDRNGTWVYVMEGDYICNAAGKWMFVVRGDRVYDTQGNWVYKVHQDRRYDMPAPPRHTANPSASYADDTPVAPRHTASSPASYANDTPAVPRQAVSPPASYTHDAPVAPRQTSDTFSQRAQTVPVNGPRYHHTAAHTGGLMGNKRLIWLAGLVPIVILIIVIIAVTGNNDDMTSGIANAGESNIYNGYQGYSPGQQTENHEAGSGQTEYNGYGEYSPGDHGGYHEAPHESTVNAAGVTAEAFSALRFGMRIDEVKNIIGVSPISETTTDLMGIATTLIMWSGYGFSSISVTFTDGYASLLMQIGLDSAPQPGSYGVTHEAFAQIRNGMSFHEVSRIIGVLPTSMLEVEAFGIVSTTILWGLEDFATITVTFTNDNATSTMQMGLDAPAYAVNNSRGINMYAFVRITTGMSIDEVRYILSQDPVSEIPIEMFGVTTTTIMWMYGMASITVTFTDGYVFSSMQLGL